MARFILKRFGLALITLWLLSVIVFTAGQVLPGDPGRAILGPLAAQSSVNALDHQLGVDKPVLSQYGTWAGDLVQGNMGTSYTYHAAVGPFVTSALGRSLKLAALAFILVVPIAVFAGVMAALSVGKPLDRVTSVMGLTGTVVPEFVSGIILILVLGLGLHVFPITAGWPPGAALPDQVYHLIMPAIPLTLILFGYIMRMARAGTIEALDADYTRTAVLKGLSRRTVIRRHVLRNSLLPTITVIATQSGYLIGGLVVVETLFRYNGIGSLVLNAASQKDFPMLEGGVLIIGIVYMVATLAADMLFSVLNPRIRYGGSE